MTTPLHGFTDLHIDHLHTQASVHKRYRITMEITTDLDPKEWDWQDLLELDEEEELHWIHFEDCNK